MIIKIKNNTNIKKEVYVVVALIVLTFLTQIITNTYFNHTATILVNLILMALILVFIVIGTSKVTSEINQMDSQLLSSKQKLLNAKQDIKTILNTLSDLTAIIDDSGLLFCNKSLVDLIPVFNDLDKFNKDNRRLCDFFENNILTDNRLCDKYSDKSVWVKYLLDNSNKNFKASFHKGDKKYYFAIKVNRVKIFDNKTAVLLVFNDITEELEIKKKLLKQKSDLYYKTNYDVLTSLPNKTMILQKLTNMIRYAKQNNHKLAMFIIDLDNFKEINDSMDHKFGDLILQLVANRLRGIVKNNDIAGRLGGDEFCLVINNIHSIDEVSKIADKIIKVMSKAYTIDNKVVYAESSIGISIYPDDSENKNNLLKYADSALHSAKYNGKNQFKYYNEKMTKDAQKRVLLEADLKKAIRDKEFVVFYQPQFDGNNGEIVGAEALIRWIHPKKGMIFPDQFIPFAESTGIIDQVDSIVKDIAISQFINWKAQNLNPGSLSLNLSPREINKKDFVNTIKDLFKSKNINPNWIEFEILERDIISNPECTINKLNSIKELGCKISLDDFGVGYSSLSHLQMLPIDKIKIDKSFIDNIPQDSVLSAIVKTIINFGKNIHVKLLAEGVENENQRDFLLKNGCEYMQGYLYSKPLTTKEFEKLLKSKA